jgi:hypothetical protein
MHALQFIATCGLGLWVLRDVQGHAERLASLEAIARRNEHQLDNLAVQLVSLQRVLVLPDDLTHR